MSKKQWVQLAAAVTIGALIGTAIGWILTDTFNIG